MTNQAIDLAPARETPEAFAERLCGVIDAGAQSVMISVGHVSGLFDVMASMEPATSDEIATRAGLAERYVREWLAVMVMADIVDYDPFAKAYHLPPERAAFLTRAASPGNIAVYAQMVPLVGAAQDRLLECLRTGEGTRYSDYPCMHKVMEEDSGQTVVARLFDSVLPLVQGIEGRLEKGIDVLDAGCGRGRALIEMARRYPASRFTGYDLCADAIEHAAARVRELGLSNIRFETLDMSGFDQEHAWDFVTTFDAVHDQKDPQDLLVRLHRSLKPGGVYLMQDIGASAKLENNREFPMASLLYTVSFSHCTPVSIGQGGEGLGTMWGWETAERMLRAAGFAEVARHVLEHDPMNVWFVSRRAA